MATLAAACLILGITGCGKGSSTVSGTVKLEGKPLRFGSVTMMGEDRIPHTGEITREGTYTVEGVPYGEVRVAVSSPDPQSAGPPPQAQELIMKGPRGKLLPPPPKIDNKGWFPIHDDNTDIRTSGLTVNVNDDKMTFDLAVTPPPK
jgi:hypothetical protein